VEIAIQKITYVEENKRALQAIKESEENYKDLFETLMTLSLSPTWNGNFYPAIKRHLRLMAILPRKSVS
jgi:uncharacterized membrane protein YjjP (DUF1212 family)